VSELTEIVRDQSQRRCLLRRRDQPLLACCVLIAGLALFVCWNPSPVSSSRATEWSKLPDHLAHFQVNVNTATWPELTQLPEIGETLARRIVENRRADGLFQAPDDLTRVRGIGQKTLEPIRPYLSPLSWSHGASQATPGTP
jgi:competence ComEA-like helix-hairpin-helix protein